jgi:biotin carboxyl carrier protein
MKALRTLLLAAAAVALAVLLVRSYREGRAGRPGDDDEAALPPAHLATSGDETVIRFDTTEVRRAGIATAPAAAVRAAPTVEVLGELAADPGAVTSVRAPVTGRLAAPRWPAVGERVAAGTEVAQVGDALPLVLARGGTVTRIGARPGELVQAGQELLALQDGATTLARIVWTETGAPPARIALAPLGAPGAGAAARFAGMAPEADPGTRRPVALYRLERSPDGAGAGTPLVARIAAGEAAAAVLVPARATVQWQGLAWAFVERAPGDYARVRVPTDLPVDGGWGVRDGIAPGDRIVVQGAQQLLSEEFRAEARVGEEVGE